MEFPEVVRVIEWAVPGYEGTYTQYQISKNGRVVISQIATRDNMARKVNPMDPSDHTYSSFETACEAVQWLIENRQDDTREI